jgi:hypothetical protein
MFVIGNQVVSEEIFEEHFVCDLEACKGACCVEGESGAPLQIDELLEVESAFEAAKKYMTQEGIDAVEELGYAVKDEDGDIVTPLIGKHGMCAYAIINEKGIAQCTFELAWKAEETTWRKPISCHLYPIRLGALNKMTAVNYHRWPICAPACSCGSKLGVPVYLFLKEPLIRKFGKAWFTELEEVYHLWKKEKTEN